MAITYHHSHLREQKLHSGEQLCRSYSCCQSMERDLQACVQLHKHPWDFRSLHKTDCDMVSNLNTEGSVSISDFPSCCQQKTKLAFNLSKEVRREVKEQ